VLGVVRRGQADAAGVQKVLEREKELDLEAIVEKFNQLLSRVYGFLKGRIGEDVEAFMSGALDDVCRQYGQLFDGVDLKSYGRADYDQMLANVADLRSEQRKSLMVAGLNELLFAIQLKVRQERGSDEEAVISAIIKEGVRRLSA
jgi:hypothetical protein